MATTGQRIKQQMGSMSIAELSRRSGVSRAHIHAILHDQSEASVVIAQQLAQALDTTLDELFDYHSDLTADERILLRMVRAGAWIDAMRKLLDMQERAERDDDGCA